MSFSGFSPETIDFLWGIRFNNNRDWFLSHKQEYLTLLYQPMKMLAAQLYEPFSEIPGISCRVSRIYKDLRFSSGNPYKDHLWIYIRSDTDRWSSAPTLCFEINPDFYRYGIVYWQPGAAIMNAFRKDLDNQPELLSMIQDAEKASGFPLEGESYVRSRNTAPRPELARFYNLKGFAAAAVRPPDELLFSSALADTVSSTLQSWLPVFNYFRQLSVSIDG